MSKQSDPNIAPLASIVIPTRNRPGYLAVTLNSLAKQSVDQHLYEVVVVDDCSKNFAEIESAVRSADLGSIETKLVRAGKPQGPNAARNLGIEAAAGDLLVVIDDDIDVPEGWLESYIVAATRYPEYEAFGGPIRARLDSSSLLKLCGRERPPITTLDLGPHDADTERVWSANMAVRRSAVERVGDFDASFSQYGGQEEEWEQRLLDNGGKIRYVAGAWLWHWRNRRDSRLVSLARAAFYQGRGLRMFDQRWNRAQPLKHEFRVLLGCLWHTVRYRCANGLIMSANCIGRLTVALGRKRQHG